ncbi:MAG: hypothetical protein JWN14_144 [Chthonomonadales bacterium]|nr:hypothetical protein [Chthonomonadales bacterium]
MENRLTRTVERIRESPGLYIGQYSIFRLSWFLEGYVFALEEIDGAESERALLRNLHFHIERNHHCNVSQNWDNILWFVTGNERAALDAFWNIWDDIIKSDNGNEHLQNST